MSEDRESETAYGRLIREAKEEAFHARRQLRREQPNPTYETKLDVAAALADYQDVLQDYSDEDALDTEWDERVTVDLDRALSKTVAIEKPAGHARNRQSTTTVEMPAVAQLSVDQLLAIAKELDQIAKELGFAAPVAESVHRTEIDEELIEEVEKWRKQNLEA